MLDVVTENSVRSYLEQMLFNVRCLKRELDSLYDKLDDRGFDWGEHPDDVISHMSDKLDGFVEDWSEETYTLFGQID